MRSGEQESPAPRRPTTEVQLAARVSLKLIPALLVGRRSRESAFVLGFLIERWINLVPPRPCPTLQRPRRVWLASRFQESKSYGGTSWAGNHGTASIQTGGWQQVRSGEQEGPAPRRPTTEAQFTARVSLKLIPAPLRGKRVWGVAERKKFPELFWKKAFWLLGPFPLAK